MNLELERLENPDALRSLQTEWSELWDRCPPATPFQSAEWLLPWWDVFHPGRIASIAIRSGGRLVGLAPLYVGDDGILRFIGTGITDRLDMLLDPEFATQGAQAILEELECASHFHECDLMELRAESRLLSVRPATGLTAVCPVVRLPASPGYNHRRNLRRYGKRLAQAGQVCYEAATAAQRFEYLDALFALHAARWQTRDEPGVLADARLREFHNRVATGFATHRWLRLFGLRFNGALAAVIYAFAARQHAFFYLTGFAPDLAEFSPGVLLLDFALAELNRACMVDADFLRGAEPYKYFWGAVDQTNYRLSITTKAAGGDRKIATGTPDAFD